MIHSMFRLVAGSLALFTALLAPPALAQETGAAEQLPPGIWTNTEDVYFAEEEGREQGEWTAVEVGENGNWRKIDAFGAAESEWQSDAIPGLSMHGDGEWQINGTGLRHARPFECWISVRKFAGQADGSEDWSFQYGLPVFDQGGRIFVDGEGEAPDATIRLRNVTWAEGSSNRPSLVIYAHRDDPVRAEGYSWAAPDSGLIGLNLRWIQASCAPASVDEAPGE